MNDKYLIEKATKEEYEAVLNAEKELAETRALALKLLDIAHGSRRMFPNNEFPVMDATIKEAEEMFKEKE